MSRDLIYVKIENRDRLHKEVFQKRIRVSWGIIRFLHTENWEIPIPIRRKIPDNPVSNLKKLQTGAGALKNWEGTLLINRPNRGDYARNLRAKISQRIRGLLATKISQKIAFKSVDRRIIKEFS